MASKVISTPSQSNQDLPHQPSLCSSPLSTLLSDLHNDNQNLAPGVTMDDLLKNVYSQPPAEAASHASFPASSIPREESKSADDIWKEIVAGGADPGRQQKMTLEDFLAKAGAVASEDVGGAVNRSVGLGAGVYAVEPAVINGSPQLAGFANNGLVDHQRVAATSGGGRRKRRVLEEPAVDKAVQQKQRRMIKNRESAARSRERKQAYTVELESLVTQLEEENARLRREEVEQNKLRLKQLMENLIPVEEGKKSPRVLKRVRSMHW